MVAQVQLAHLVDLALCDPEVGAVNFNHLRTLLLAILKVTNQENTLVEPKTILENSIASKTQPNGRIEQQLIIPDEKKVCF